MDDIFTASCTYLPLPAILNLKQTCSRMNTLITDAILLSAFLKTSGPTALPILAKRMLSDPSSTPDAEQRFITFASRLLHMGCRPVPRQCRSKYTGGRVVGVRAGRLKWPRKCRAAPTAVDGAGTYTYTYPLPGATSGGHVGVARAILEEVRNVDSQTLRRSLAQAALAGSEDMVNLLLEFGASVDGMQQPNPLAYAVASGNSRIVKRFLELGAVGRESELVKAPEYNRERVLGTGSGRRWRGTMAEWRGTMAEWSEEYNKIREMLLETGVEVPDASRGR
ncbi:hypothetical protein HK104_000552 [Borealophlyctis nickersoniae]|nr:hypothetical protein HK104_000552 [Borealophlyctis nickersoniae]